MTIDKNNCFIREDSLTEEQYVEVCKYLVGNYGKGSQYLKVHVASCLGDVSDYRRWLFVGVRDGLYKNFSISIWEDDLHPDEITYQQFLEHIKGVVSTPDTNLPTLCENTSQSLTDTLEWLFELGVERVEADSERMTITHKRIGKIVMDVTVDFKDIKSMLEGLKDN